MAARATLRRCCRQLRALAKLASTVAVALLIPLAPPMTVQLLTANPVPASRAAAVSVSVAAAGAARNRPACLWPAAKQFHLSR